MDSVDQWAQEGIGYCFLSRASCFPPPAVCLLLSAFCFLMPLGPKNRKHLVAFHAWPHFDFTKVFQVFLQLLQNASAQFSVGHLSSPKPNRRFDFIAFLEPLTRTLHAIAIIVLISSRPKLDFFNRDDDLLLLGLVRLLFGLVLELAKVNDLANG